MPDPSLEQQVLRYRRRLVALCLKMLGDVDDAKDAAQDVLIAALTNLDSFRSEAGVWTWLYRIALNRCLNLKKQWPRRIRPAALTEFVGEGGHDTFEDLLADPAPLIEDRVLRAEASEILFAEFERLPEDERVAIALRYHAGMSYLDAATALDVTVGAYKSRLYRARQRLLERLDHNPVWRERQATD